MHALTHCANALRRADHDAFNELVSKYSEGIKTDLRSYSAYYDKFSGTAVFDAAQDLNDTYLKINGQEKGKLSYEEDVALIMRYYDSIMFFQPEVSALISSVPLALQTSTNT